MPAPDLFADVKHRCFIAFTFADHDRPLDRKRVERSAHRIDRGLIGAMPITATHQARGSERRSFGHAYRFECEVAIHFLFSSHSTPIFARSASGRRTIFPEGPMHACVVSPVVSRVF